MGSCIDYSICDKKGNLKETWKFTGQIILNNQNISHKVNGKIKIIENNNIKEIQVEGKTEGKSNSKTKFNIQGKESHENNDEKDPKKTTFQILGENENYPKEIILIKNDKNKDKAEIESEFECKKYGLCKLSLSLDLKKKEKETLNANSKSDFKSAEETTDEEIISNSKYGLKNLGNTCYINSSLQILIHIPQFVELIKGFSDFEDNIVESINSIFKEIINLKKNKITNYSINPEKFLKLFLENHYSDYYNNYNQLDSEMFLEDLLWDINEEILQLGPIELNLPKPNTPKEEEYFEYLRESQDEIYFKMKDLFYVTFIHEKKCEKCHYVSYYFDDSPGLKLNFEKTNYYKNIDLMTLICENFKEPIKIKSSLDCEKCKQSKNIIETTRIAKLPKVLILSLQKTNKNNTRKYPWNVKYDAEFGIKEIVDQELSKDDPAIYQHFAINNHCGYSPISGHYWSSIFLEKYKKWYCFDDESVSRENGLTYSETNYILFYKQKHN